MGEPYFIMCRPAANREERMSQDVEKNIPWLEFEKFLQRTEEVGKAQRRNLKVSLGKDLSHKEKFAFKFSNFYISFCKYPLKVLI